MNPLLAALGDQVLRELAGVLSRGHGGTKKRGRP